MTNKKTYGVRWSGNTKVWKAMLPEKSTVKEVLLKVNNKMGLSENQIANLTLRGSYRPQDKYTLNQYAPTEDILVIYVI